MVLSITGTGYSWEAHVEGESSTLLEVGEPGDVWKETSCLVRKKDKDETQRKAWVRNISGLQRKN